MKQEYEALFTPWKVGNLEIMTYVEYYILNNGTDI